MKRTGILIFALTLLTLTACRVGKMNGDANFDSERGFIHMLRETCATENAFYKSGCCGAAKYSMKAVICICG